MTKKYILALFLVSIMGIGAFFSLKNVTQRGDNYVSVMNICNQERLLTQRTALLVNVFLSEPNQSRRDKILNELSMTANQMTKTFDHLINTDPKFPLPIEMSPTIHNLYFENPINLAEDMRNYIQIVREFIAKMSESEQYISVPSPIVFTKTTEILDGWGLIIDQYAKENIARINFIHDISQFVLGGFLLFLFLVGFFIFRPMVKETNEKIRNLTEKNEKIQQFLEKESFGNRSKMTFLSSMSHSLRNPMNGVLGMSELMMDTPINEQQKEMMSMIHSSAASIVTLMDDIIDYTLLESRKIVINKTTFNLRYEIQEIISIFEKISHEKNIPLIVEFDRDLPTWIEGDPERLRQVIVNIIANAFKFTLVGTVVLQIKQEQLIGDGDLELKFSIIDTGIGIAEDKKDSIFMFFDETNNDAHQGKSSGLGLMICKRLVEIMDGQMWVESELGIGSSFIFTIKTRKMISVSEMGQKSPVKLDVLFSRVYPAKILIVEDNDVNQKVALGLLKKIGYSADLANNGLVAVEKEKEKKYDIIFMDIHMPEMDGHTAKGQIFGRYAQKSDRPKIIAMTAEMMQDEIDGMMQGGWDGYVIKPATTRTIADAIVNVFECND